MRYHSTRHAIPVARTVADPSTLTGTRACFDWHVVIDTELVWVRNAYDPHPIFHRIGEWTPDGDAWRATLCGQPRYWPCPAYDCPDRDRTAATRSTATALTVTEHVCTAHVGGPRGETVPYRFLNPRIARPCRRCFTPARAVNILPETS